MTIDYQRGKIYSIVNDVNDIIYVGSTAVPRLCTRMVQHRSCSKKPDQMSNFYTAMRTLGTDHFRIVLDHVFPCNSKDELVAEEMKTLDAHIAAGKSAYNSIVGGKLIPEVRQRVKAGFTDARKAKLAADHTGERNSIFVFGSIGLYTDAKNPKPRWVFSYSTAGIRHVKSFATTKHGFWQAKLLAEAERKRVYPEWKSDEEMATEELMAIDL